MSTYRIYIDGEYAGTHSFKRELSDAQMRLFEMEFKEMNCIRGESMEVYQEEEYQSI